MKNLLLILFTIIQMSLFAQVTLEHTFVNESVQHTKTHLKSVYYVSQPTSNQIIFYNENYSFYTTTTITPPNGYELYLVGSVSDQSFNTDNLMEFTCGFVDTLNNSGYMLKLYNENGLELYNFGNMFMGAFHTTYTGQARFSVSRYTNYPNPFFETDIYSLPGSIIAGIAGENSTENKSLENNPYPNPANDYINLKYDINHSEITDLNIFNSNGQLVETMKIGGDFNTIKLDVSSYSKGIYFYRYNFESKKFIVK